jgi:hypothetical protein
MPLKTMQECWLPDGYNSTNVQLTSTGITIINMAAAERSSTSHPSPWLWVMPDPNHDPNRPRHGYRIAVDCILPNDEATRNRIRILRDPNIRGFEVHEDKDISLAT